MSVLRDRIMSQGATADSHPVGTAATPMVMPLAEVRYVADDAVYYEALQPIVAADGAIIPAKSGGTFAPVVPAGQG